MIVDVVWLIGLIVICLVGIVLTAFQLPGTWLILAATLVYAWHGEWIEIHRSVLYILGALAVVGEIVEFAGSSVLARRAGASRRASLYALIGGLAGMVVFTPLLPPIPVIGALLGGIVGCFVGAVLGEITVRNDLSGAARAGVFAAIGRVVGAAGKLAVAFAMTGLSVVSAIGALIRR